MLDYNIIKDWQWMGWCVRLHGIHIHGASVSGFFWLALSCVYTKNKIQGMYCILNVEIFQVLVFKPHGHFWQFLILWKLFWQFYVLNLTLTPNCPKSLAHFITDEITGSLYHWRLYQVNLSIVGNKLTILVVMGTDYIMIYHTTMTLKNDSLFYLVSNR